VILGGLLLAVAGWAFTFALSWGNFWIKIGVTVILVSLYSLSRQRPPLSFGVRDAALGVLAAALLYGIFYLGFVLSPFVVPDAVRQVGDIYDRGAGTSTTVVALLLLFVTGPGEEVFWRGFLQENLMARYGGGTGFVMTTLLYGAVHVFSLNFMLVMAAFVAGAFWGGLYLWRRNLVPVIVSHSLWSACIFAVFPIR